MLGIMESSLKYLIFLFGIVFSSITFSHEKVVDGGSLYLVRQGFETHRGEFNYAQDCDLIAKIMNEKEPNVTWLCSTSKKPVEYKCSLKGVTIINSDKNTKEVLDFDFSLSMNRGKAKTSLTAAVSSFDYVKSGHVIKLTNDYPYVSGNYFSSAVAYITINTDTSESIAINFGLKENGKGKCSVISR